MTSPDTQETSRSNNEIRTWPKWFCVMLRAGGASGIMFSLLALIVFPLYAPTVIRKLQESTSSAAGQIEELAEVLDLTAEALDQTAIMLGGASGAFSTTNLFIEDSVALIQTLGVMLGEKAPDTIDSTQQALEAAQEGAKAIDSTLRALSVIEFLTGVSYDPEKSLSASLEDVALSLKPLPNALRDVHEEMTNSASSLEELPPQFSRIAADLNAFAENASKVAQDIGTRGNALEDLAGQIDDLSTKISTWAWVVTGVLMLLSVGMAIVQSAVYAVGTRLSEENNELS